MKDVHYVCSFPFNQNNCEKSIMRIHNMITEFINIYKKNMNFYLVRIIYFHDDIIEKQFTKMRELKVIMIKEIIRRLIRKKSLIIAIVIRKRNHIRFFSKDNEKNQISKENVFSDIIIDREITHSRDFDFCTF